ncbi:MAG: hypothetical protein PHU44_09935, partial [Syntrophales bacterium]|nr:hypothetical protein [Syntrophales bacterium]
MKSFIDYEVSACPNVPAGLPRQRLTVLSPIWRGRTLRLEYPDGTVHVLKVCSGPDAEGLEELRVFWTRHQPEAPAACLALGGEHGLLILDPGGTGAGVQGHPFLALAE